MRRQGKPAVDVSSEENVLTLLWPRLGLVPREPRRLVRDQSPLNQVVDVVLTDCRADPVALDPARRQAGPRRRSALAGLLPFRLRRRLLCALQSLRLLLHHCSERSSNRAAAPRVEVDVVEKTEEKEEEWERTVQKTPIWHLI